MHVPECIHLHVHLHAEPWLLDVLERIAVSGKLDKLSDKLDDAQKDLGKTIEESTPPPPGTT